MISVAGTDTELKALAILHFFIELLRRVNCRCNQQMESLASNIRRWCQKIPVFIHVSDVVNLCIWLEALNYDYTVLRQIWQTLKNLQVEEEALNGKETKGCTVFRAAAEFLWKSSRRRHYSSNSRIISKTCCNSLKMHLMYREVIVALSCLTVDAVKENRYGCL